MCMNVLLVLKYVHHMSVWCPQKSKEDFRYTELELQMVASHHMGAEN